MNLRAFVSRIAVLVVPFLLLAAAVPASGQISVISTTPNNAAQGTVNLNVTISGNGFKKGAKAQWFVSGTTNPGGVTVNSTAFSGSSTLVANITVAQDAVIGNFDVQVMNSDGRTGKGTELFAVKVPCQATMTIQPIVISGACSSPGCLDSTFGSGGIVTTNVTPNSPRGQNPRAIAVQPDGKLIAAGTSNGWIIVRYDTFGNLDPSFGVGGVANYFSGPSGITSIALQSDGRIVVGGYTVDARTNHYFAVGRLNPDGTLDPSFGSGGTVQLKLSSHNDFNWPYAVLIQDDGRIVAVGFADSRWALVRFNTDGSLDGTFGSGGEVLLSVGSGGALYDAKLQYVTLSTGSIEQRIVVAGSVSSNKTSNDFAISRFLANGQIDSSFGSAGMTTTDFCGYDDRAWSLGVDSLGRFLLGGPGTAAAPSGQGEFGIARYSSTGQLDTSFGVGGKLLTTVPYFAPNGTNGYPLIDSIDRIVFLGYVDNSTIGSLFAAFRLNPDGSLDTTFANGAIVQPGTPFTMGHAIQPDGKFVLGGTPSNNLFTIWRVLP